jgi:transposase
MAPLVRRSWAPAGQPPVLKQKAAHREKVSVAGALWLTPGWDRLGLAYQTLVNGYFNNEAVAAFLDAALQGLAGPVIVIWDGGNMHKGPPIREAVAASGGRLILERLPPHTPELMPLEQVWAWLKYDRLYNYAPEDAQRLNRTIVRELDPIRTDQKRLKNFFHASCVPLPRTLLF